MLEVSSKACEFVSGGRECITSEIPLPGSFESLKCFFMGMTSKAQCDIWSPIHLELS